MVDELQRELPSQHASFVLDSRLGFHFVPQSVKIFLTVSPDVAASRILATRRESEHLHDAAEGKEKLIERERSDRQRYLRLYGVDHTTLSRYDLVLDSTHASAWELVEQILAELKKRELLQ
jgi:cytidylate kinase